jgi:hypothetical protein
VKVLVVPDALPVVPASPSEEVVWVVVSVLMPTILERPT